MTTARNDLGSRFRGFGNPRSRFTRTSTPVSNFAKTTPEVVFRKKPVMTSSTFAYRRLTLVLTAAVAVMTACEQPPNAPTRGFESNSVRATPTPTFTPTPLPLPTPSPEAPKLQFLGAVTDEDGMPLVGASVVVEYQHPNGQYQYHELKTIENGRYSAHLPARANAQIYGQPNTLAVMHSWHTGYDWNVQIVGGNAAENEIDFRLRRPRRIDAGASVTLTVDRFSSLCADLDWDYNFKGRC